VSTSLATEASEGGAPQNRLESERSISISQAWILMGALTFITTITAFARNKLAAVVLGPEGIGIYAQGLAFLTFAATFCTLGMGQGIVKHLAERDRGLLGGISHAQIIRRSLQVQLGVASAVAALVIAFSKPLAGFLFGDKNAWNYVIVVGVTIPFTVLLSNFGYFLQGLKRVRAFTAASAINAVIGVVLFSVLILVLRLNGAILGLLTTTVVGVLVFWLTFLKTSASSESVAVNGEKRDQSQLTLTLLKYGGVVFVSGSLETLTALLLRTWIVNYSGAVQNGIYQAVIGLSGQYIGFFALFNNAYLYPRLSSLRSPVDSVAEMNYALRTGLLLAVPLIAGVIIFRHELILLLFTKAFLPASNVLVWQAIGDVLKITSWFIAASLLPRGRLREYLGLSIFFAALYLFLSFRFLQKWDLTGLALAYCLSYLIFILVLLAVQVKLISFKLSTNSMAVVLASGALLFGIVWLPNVAAIHYAVKVGLVVAWFFALEGPRWLASAVRGVRTMTFPSKHAGPAGPNADNLISLGGGPPPAEGDSTRCVTVIVPVRNEAANIEQLITNLQSQTFQPAEIVIADGGSTDRTREIVRDLQSCSTVPIILLEDYEAFPGRGRNLAIRRATNDWIACVDAGIVPNPNWLEELVAASKLNPEKHLIQGCYQPITDSYFTECAAIAYVAPEGAQAPSVASCLLHRSAWKAAHGFPEDLRSGEDLIFFQRLKAIGAEKAFSNRAMVHWQLQPDTASTFRRFSTYSRYGMKAGLATDWQVKVSLVYMSFAGLVAASLLWWPFALLPILLLFGRSQRRIYRWYAAQGMRRRIIESLNPRRVLLVTWINVVIDLAMFRGMVDWFLIDLIGKRDGHIKL
jgi:polysaccharide transporter, PST family